MECLKCGGEKTRVIDTRDFGQWRKRRYVCVTCGGRFSTEEWYHDDLVKVIKKETKAAQLVARLKAAAEALEPVIRDILEVCAEEETAAEGDA